MNELALGVLEIKYELPQIKYDLTELNAEIKKLTDQYSGYVIVDESELPNAKKILANLNATAKEISDMRISTVKKIKVPLDTFETEIKDLTKKLDALATEIKAQVGDYDVRIKERKRAEIKALSDYAPYTVFNETWLNKTIAISQIESDLAEQKKSFQTACGIIQTTCTICELETEKYFEMLTNGAELNDIVTLIKNDKAIKEKYANVPPQAEPIVAINVDTDLDIYIRTYKIKGTKAQLTAVYDYMQKIGVLILEKN